jgi:hypothetical protein
MVALTSSRATPQKGTELAVFPVAAGVKIYGGSLVALNAAGYLVPGTTSTTLRYQGRAEDFADNTGGADGAKTLAVRRKQAFKFANSQVDPLGQADVGNTVYIVDDQTVAKTNGAGTRSAAGKLLSLEFDGVWIE